MRNFTIVVIALIFSALLLGLAPPVQAGVVGDPFGGDCAVKAPPIQVNGMPGGVTIIEAENFDCGGEGIAYHDPHSCGAVVGTGCSCTQTYRPDGVNVCAGAGTYVSYTDAGLWVEYTIRAAMVGNYTVELLVAFSDCPQDCAKATYHVELDGTPTKSIALGPAFTGGWQNFEWRGRSELIGLTAGIHRLRIVVDHGWFNWDAVRVKYAAGIEWQAVPVWKVYP